LCLTFIIVLSSVTSEVYNLSLISILAIGIEIFNKYKDYLNLIRIQR
jgi:hypothetical protein